MATSGTILRRMPVTVPTDGGRQSSSGSGEKATLASGSTNRLLSSLPRDHVNFIRAPPPLSLLLLRKSFSLSLSLCLMNLSLFLSLSFPPFVRWILSLSLLFPTLSFFLAPCFRLALAWDFLTTAGILECRCDTLRPCFATEPRESVTWRVKLLPEPETFGLENTRVAWLHSFSKRAIMELRLMEVEIPSENVDACEESSHVTWLTCSPWIKLNCCPEKLHSHTFISMHLIQ